MQKLKFSKYHKYGDTILELLMVADNFNTEKNLFLCQILPTEAFAPFQF